MKKISAIFLFLALGSVQVWAQTCTSNGQCGPGSFCNSSDICQAYGCSSDCDCGAGGSDVTCQPNPSDPLEGKVCIAQIGSVNSCTNNCPGGGTNFQVLALTPSANPVLVGNMFTITFQATNEGPQPAYQPVVSLSWNSSIATLVSYTVTSGWTLFSTNGGLGFTTTGAPFPVTVTATVLANSAGTLNALGSLTSGDCAGPGSRGEQVIPVTVNNPAPVLTSISPTSMAEGSPGFTLTAIGSSFVNGSVIQWNGSALTTTFVSSTQLTALVPASDIASAGTANITVFTTGPGGGTSRSKPFEIIGPPQAQNQNLTTAYQTALPITLTGTDSNTPPLSLTYAVVTQPTHGTLTGTAPNVTYTPNNGYTGPDNFTFKVNNGYLNSNVAIISITVSAPTASPTANPQSVTVPFQTPKPITLTGSDPNNLPLTYAVLTQPTHGTLSGTAPNVTYSPSNGYAGPDSFTFKVNNGFQNSAPATVSITVSSPTAGAPTANPQSVTVPFQTATGITLTGVDHNTPPLPLTFTVVGNPGHGTLTGTAPNLTYTPANGYAGSDSFTFMVNNGFQNSAPATISITVSTPTAGAPTANPQSVTVPFQTATGITLTGVDHNTPPLPLIFTVIGNPAHGTLTGAAPNLTYTPANGYAGADSFTFKVNNGFQDSNIATISITVSSPTAAPTANNQNVTVPFQTSTGITLTGVDHDTPPLPLSFTVVSNPTHGLLAGTAPNLTYTPANGYTGPDSFTFKVNNGFADSNIATVSITVSTPTAGTPTANPQSVTVPFQTPTAITLTGADHNTPPLSLTFAVVGNPAHGTLTGSAPNLTYTPANGYAGPDSFTFKDNNGFQDSNIATVSITVSTPTAGAPVAHPQSVTVPFQTPTAITLTGTDFNTPPLPLTFTMVGNPAHGTLTGTAPNVTYTPANGYAGPDSFSFKVNNGFQDSIPATVSITVSTPTAGAPTANPQSVTVPFQTATGVTLTGVDHNTPPLPLTYSVVTQPTHGTLSGTAPNITYAPNNGYAGPDSFTFMVNNGFQNSVPATVSITVSTPTAGAPTANPQSVTVPFQTATGITLTGVDHNTPPLPLTFAVVGNPAHGTLTGAAPNLTYTPANGYAGSDSFTFKVNNGFQDSNIATISITVSSPTAAPTANNQSVTVLYQTPTAITLTGSDPNGLPLTYILVSTSTHGGLSGTAPNVTYTPNNGYIGPDSFTFKVNNGFQDSNVATVSISVQTQILDHILVTPDGKVINVGDSLQFVATGYTANNQTIPNLTFTWKEIGDSGSLSASPTSASFNSAGGFYGSRVYTITAATGGKTGIAHVTVLSPSPFASSICGAVAYPVPYKSSTGLPGVTFTHLAAGTQIRIFTSDARIVRTLYSQNGEDVLWDLRNTGGEKVASWVYLYILNQNGPCSTVKGKLVIIQ